MTKTEHKESIIKNLMKLFDDTPTDNLRMIDGYIQGICAADKLYKETVPVGKKKSVKSQPTQ